MEKHLKKHKKLARVLLWNMAWLWKVSHFWNFLINRWHYVAAVSVYNICSISLLPCTPIPKCALYFRTWGNDHNVLDCSVQRCEILGLISLCFSLNVVSTKNLNNINAKRFLLVIGAFMRAPITFGTAFTKLCFGVSLSFFTSNRSFWAIRDKNCLPSNRLGW